MAMKLYHGSNVTVSEPKILESSRALDFGNAFYMTSRLEQAKMGKAYSRTQEVRHACGG